MTASDTMREQNPGKPPITSHPAFPAVVALWFAALLGLGSLILPGTLLDRVVAATGFSSIIPAAAPPLGFTARGLIALAAAILGAVAGFVLARRIGGTGNAAGEPHGSRLALNGRRAPISALDELGDEGLGEARPPSLRRRALAIGDDRQHYPAVAAPLHHVEPDAVEDEEARHPFEPAGEFDMAPEPAKADDIDHEEEMSALAPPPAEDPAPASVNAEKAHPAPAVAGAPAPLEELGLMQLVERLQTSLQRRRELGGNAGRATPPPALVDRPAFDVAPATEAARATAAYFGMPGFTPVPDEADEPEESDLSSFSLPLHTIAAAPSDLDRTDTESPPSDVRPFDPPAAPEPEAEAEVEPEAEAEEAQPPLMGEAADEALRVALARLQRLSGAA